MNLSSGRDDIHTAILLRIRYIFSLKRRSISLAGRIHAKTHDVILATLWWVSHYSDSGAPQRRLSPQAEPGTDVRRPVAPQGTSRHRARRVSDWGWAYDHDRADRRQRHSERLRRFRLAAGRPPA